jgi:hypothetical protein
VVTGDDTADSEDLVNAVMNCKMHKLVETVIILCSCMLPSKP